MLKIVLLFVGFWLYAFQSQVCAKIYGTYENVGTAPATVRQLITIPKSVVLAPGSYVEIAPPLFHHELKGFQHEIQLPKGGSIVLKDLNKPCDGGKLISIERRVNGESSAPFETSLSSECVDFKKEALYFKVMIQNNDVHLIPNQQKIN
ncbi:MAG: hypothetical protein ACRCYZ_02670 [Alphaproteobacteria bacterium]